MFIPPVPSYWVDNFFHLIQWAGIFLGCLFIFAFLLFGCITIVYLVRVHIDDKRYSIVQDYLRENHISLKLLLKYSDKFCEYWIDD